jgi:hypothetical protein
MIGVWGVGCGVWGVGCGVWGVGCGVWGCGLVESPRTAVEALASAYLGFTFLSALQVRGRKRARWGG